MVKPTKARIAEDWILKLFKCRVSLGCPHIANSLCIFLCHNFTERQSAHLKMRNEIAVKLEKPNKAGHIADQLGKRPVTQEVVFWHGWSISIRKNVDPDKLEPLKKEVALFQAKGQPVRLANA
jgi:hypothetical protein